jgi:hypothetical protein
MRAFAPAMLMSMLQSQGPHIDLRQFAQAAPRGILIARNSGYVPRESSMIPIQTAVPLRYPPVATWTLIAINCGIFLCELGLSEPALQAFLSEFAGCSGSTRRDADEARVKEKLMTAMDVFWIFFMLSALQPVLRQRMLEGMRMRKIAKIEAHRNSRVILLAHRQETMRFLAFAVMCYIDINDFEEAGGPARRKIVDGHVDARLSDIGTAGQRARPQRQHQHIG